MWKRLSRGGNDKDERGDAKEQKKKKWLSESGQDVESAIAPEGRRDTITMEPTASVPMR